MKCIKENIVYLEPGVPKHPAINPIQNRPQVRSESIVGE